MLEQTQVMEVRMRQPKAWVAWSSGKDSAWALYTVRQQGDTEIAGLLTTITEGSDRIAVHGVREELLRAQAASLGLPLHLVRIPAACPNTVYEATMRHAFETASREGVSDIVFGDLFLEDIRAYREQLLAQSGMRGVFPLWQRDTAALAREMIAGGLRAYLVCIDSQRMPRGFAGRAFDESLLQDLPNNVDPCGENGEFHTFSWDGPMFRKPIAISVGPPVEQNGFVLTDLLAGDVVRR
jgi:uncharacterized protein (TIGR00290 family)